jgi:hypothetical protein
MNAKKLNQLLINRFPELAASYLDEVSWQEGDDTGSHVVYGDVFAPFIEQSIDLYDKNKLKEIFDFIEKLLLLKDDYVEDVISLSVLERLKSEPVKSGCCSEFMNEQTKKLFETLN